MAISREQFYADYDNLMPLVCQPYARCLRLGAAAVSLDSHIIADIGIGSGNFSSEVFKRFKHHNKTRSVRFLGIDKDSYAFDLVRSKIPGIHLSEEVFDPNTLIVADYYLGSLMTHHFTDDVRAKSLVSIAKNARKGFVNFDVFLTPEFPNLAAITDHVKTYASASFDADFLALLEKDMSTNDHPATLKEHQALFMAQGMKFDVLLSEAPYAVYHAYWPTKKR